MNKKIEYICSECGGAFVSFKKKNTLKCEKCLKKARDYKKNEETKSPYRKPNHGNREIYHDMRRLREYNAEHNTNLSYGQFKLMKSFEKEKMRQQKKKK